MMNRTLYFFGGASAACRLARARRTIASAIICFMRGDSDMKLRRQRGRVRRQKDHVVEGQFLDLRLHDRAREHRAHPVLELIELPEEIARRTTGDRGNGTESLQV